MPAPPLPLACALEIMGDWLGLPERAWMATVYRFSEALPGGEILEAVQIAQARVSVGGLAAFRHFCGVCHSRIRQQRIRRSCYRRPPQEVPFPPRPR